MPNDGDIASMMKEAAELVGATPEDVAAETPPAEVPEKTESAPAESAPVVEPEKPAEKPAEVVEPKPVAEPDDRLKALAMLTRREREAAKKDKELKEKEARFSKLEKIAALMEKDKFAAVEELGGKDLYVEWTNKLLGEQGQAKPADGNSEVLSKIRSLEDYLKNKEESAKKAKEDEESERAEKAYFGSIRDTTKDASFELINSYGDPAREEVVKFAKSQFDTFGTVMEPKEAAQAMEAFFESLVVNGLKTKKGLALAKKALGISESAPAKSEEAEKEQKTIRQAADAAPPKFSPDDDDTVMAEAVALLRGQSKG